MLSRSVSLVAVAALAAITAPAQEHYWVANNGSSDVRKISSCGHVVLTVPLGYAGGACSVAPDGKVWVAQSLGARITVMNQDGSTVATPTFAINVGAGGRANSIAFTKDGHAWITGNIPTPAASMVEEYDANGTWLVTHTLPASAPLGVTVDADGNVWVAHRVGPPGSVSRIDAVTRAITSHPLFNSLILPTDIYADMRGPGVPSHIWVAGDNRGSGELFEFDSTGSVVNRHVISATCKNNGLTGDIDPATGTTANIWTAEWTSATSYRLHRFSLATSTFTSFTIPHIYSVTCDGFGNLWGISTNASTAMRVDELTAAIEFAAPIGTTPRGGLSTRWQDATTVDPNGDLDGDLVPNLLEVQLGSSPNDRGSGPGASIRTDGPTTLGSIARVSISASAADATGLMFGFGALPVGIPLAGFSGTFQLDIVLPLSVTLPGPASFGIPLGTDPTTVGLVLHIQGLNLNALAFTNVACIKLFQ